MKRGFVDGPEGQIFYREAGIGRPVILMHQILRTSLDYEFVIPILAEHYRVVAMDNMGCGDSDAPPRPLSIEAHAHAIATAMDGLGIERAVLVGHHSGANQALEIGLQRPDLVDAVVLSGLFYVDDPAERARLHRKALTLQHPATRADGSHLLEIWSEGLRTNWGKPRFPAERTDLLAQFFIEQVKTGARRFEPYVAVMEYDTAARLPRLNAPCLFVKGCDDIPMCAGSELWIRDQPQARLVEIQLPGGGEMPRLCPQTWSSAILDFLASEGICAGNRSYVA